MEQLLDENQLSFEDQEVVNISHPRLKNILESLLFVTKKPITVDEIRKVIRIDKGLIERSLHELIAEYSRKGIVIAKIAGGFQMVTSHDNVKWVDKLLKSPIETTLSQAALEALTIVAFKQPVTRLEIESIRGVASDGVIQTLLERRMITEVGRSSGLGRPRLYGTTIEFLRHFGLKELSDLPPIPQDEIGHDSFKSVFNEEEKSEQSPIPEVKEEKPVEQVDNTPIKEDNPVDQNEPLSVEVKIDNSGEAQNIPNETPSQETNILSSEIIKDTPNE